MSVIIKPRAEVEREERLLREARIKVARSSSTEDFEAVAKKFVQAVMDIRAAMKAAGSNNYEYFFGGFEECDKLLQDPLYWASAEAQKCYQLLLGADQWLKHEADKLGEDYISPEHFYKAWLVCGVDLRALMAEHGITA